MLTLSETTDTIEVVLGAAHTTTSLKCYASWRDLGSSTFPAGRTVIATNGTTAIVAVPAPGASTKRVVDTMSVYNADSVSQNVIVRFDANGTEYVIRTETLAPGELLMYTDARGWASYSTTGALKSPGINLGIASPAWNQVILGSDVTDSSGANTITDITGLSFSVTAGRRYLFRFFIIFTTPVNTTGMRFSVNGPASPTELTYQLFYTNSATSQQVSQALSAYDLPASSTLSSLPLPSGGNAYIEGMIVPSANGTVVGRFASEIDTSALIAKQGSVLEWLEVI
jgi:hypothetical protein